MQLYTNATFLFSQSIVFARRRSLLPFEDNNCNRSTHLYLFFLDLYVGAVHNIKHLNRFLLTIICTASPLLCPTTHSWPSTCHNATTTGCPPLPLLPSTNPRHYLLLILHSIAVTMQQQLESHHFHCWQSSPVTPSNNFLILHPIVCHNATTTGCLPLPLLTQIK